MLRRRRRQSGYAAATRPPMVMVADDDVLVRELLDTGLRRKGFAVQVFADGEQLLHAVRTDPPAAVVVDWLMPGPQGPDICSRMKADAATARVPVLMLTSRGMDQHVEQALAAGVDDYVTKPFHVAEVARVVQQLISSEGSQ